MLKCLKITGYISTDDTSNFSKTENKPSKNKDRVWNNCKGINTLTILEVQYIILLFQTGLDPLVNMVFESIITNFDIKNNVSNFSVEIPFGEAIADVLPVKGTSKEGMCRKKTTFEVGPLKLKCNFEINQNSSVLLRNKLEKATPFPLVL